MERRAYEINRLCTEYLMAIGIPAKLTGFEYLRLAVSYVVEEPELLNNITKQLYPRIAATMGTKEPAIERSMRHAIEFAYGSKGLLGLNDIFGCVIYRGDHKPTNSELIALLAEKIVFELEKLK